MLHMVIRLWQQYTFIRCNGKTSSKKSRKQCFLYFLNLPSSTYTIISTNILMHLTSFFFIVTYAIGSRNWSILFLFYPRSLLFLLNFILLKCKLL